MKHVDLRARILMAIGAGGAVAVACGGIEAERAPGDAGIDAARDATVTTPADGAAEASVDASTADALDASIADALDAAPDVGTDAGVDACPVACLQTGAACQQDCDCCNSSCDRPNGEPCAGYIYGCTCLTPSCADVCVQNGDPCVFDCDCCPGGTHCEYGTGDAGYCDQTVRRPFLVGSSIRKAEAEERADWSAGVALDPSPDLDPTTARALARDWLRDALDEHASIAAFARFTMHLLAVGAPPDLVLASQRAARDEVRHAEACFALARRYGGRSLGPAPLALDGAMVSVTLADVAALTAEEGCVGETLGALLAEDMLALPLDPAVRATLTRANLARDEARHAELAWRFVAWAVARGGRPVRDAVRAAVDRAVAATVANPVRIYPGVHLAAWRAHGRFTCAEARAIALRGIREIIRPAMAALLPEEATASRRSESASHCSS